MENKIFEQKIDEKMVEFRLKPTDLVWKQVENRIQQKKKRRVIFWWIFVGMIMAGTAIQYFISNENEFQPTSSKAISNPKSNQKVDASTENHRPSSDTENELNQLQQNVPSVSETTKKQIFQKDDIDIERSNFVSNEIDHPVSSRTPQENFINTANIDRKMVSANPQVVDTIIIRECEELGINSSAASSAAVKKNIFDRQWNFNAHYSFHGTGDLSGTYIEFGYEKKLGKRYGFYNNIGMSIHSRKEFFSSNNNTSQLNARYNAMQYVTTAIQTSPTFYRYSKRGDVKIGAGMVARYQTSSRPSRYSISPQPATQGIFTTSIREMNPNSFSLGYKISVELHLLSIKKTDLGFQMFFQNDTKGDVITGFGLSLQNKFKKQD
jgi:hypothetical protein